MNLFQARPGRRVEALVLPSVKIGTPLWSEAVVVSRDFWRQQVLIEFKFGNARTTISCEGNFELPRVRPGRG